ncbi:MAG: phage tail length tape measure family protein [Bacteroidales bacterium]
MAEPIGALHAELSAGHAQFAADMGKAKRAVQTNATGMQKAMAKVGGAFSGATSGLKAFVSALAIGATIRAVIQATNAQQAAVTQLNQTLKSTGRLTPELSQQLQDYAASLQKVTTYGDEAIIPMQALLLTFGRIGGDEFNRAQKAVLDMATMLKMDLKSAATMVGKALNDPVKGMTAMSKAGVSFTDSQKAIVKEMMEVGDVAGAQRIILKELETEYGGSAEAARHTLGGALQSLKNAFGDLMEGDSGQGGVKGATAAIEDLTGLLSDPQTVANAQVLTNALITGFGKVIEAISTTVEFTKWLSEELASKVYGAAHDDIVRLEDNLEDAKEKLKGLESSKVGITFSGNVRDQIKAIEAAREEVAKLEKQVGDYYESQAKGAGKSGTPKVPTTPNVPTIATGETEGGATGGGASKRDAVIERGQAAIKDLERELALLGDKTEVEKVLWELENGRYADLSTAHKERIETLTREIQAGKEVIEAKKAEADAADEADKQRIASMEQLMGRMQEYYEEHDSAVANFNDDYRQAIMTTQEYELAKLQERYDAYAEHIEDKAALDRWYEEEKKKIADSGEKTASDMTEFQIQAYRSMQSAMSEFLFDPFEDGLDGMLRSFTDMIRKMIAEALAAKILKSLLGEDFGSGGALGGLLGGLFGSAKGNAFSGGRLIPFAHGGIVDRPTVFPMAQGAGLMGEAGPEAVLPLARTAGGDLGVNVASEKQQDSIENNVRIINVLDPSVVGNYLSTAAGERLIVNYMQRNKRVLT